MNRLSSQERKLVYMGGIVLLMLPIVWIGLPPGSDAEETGGVLAGIRRSQDLGDSTLGQVDPASSTMSLVLFGFRGIAASMLWYQADELRSQKNWSELQRTADSIVLLQPHYWNVWDTQAWNLAYNVSAEFDDVRDRFYWVKEGAKFLQRGVDRNDKIPELYHYMGEFVGRKIGYSDEKDLFRQYFLHDPDEYFDTGEADNDGRPEDDWLDNTADPEVNPGSRHAQAGHGQMDNYLVAKLWYAESNRVLMDEAGGEQHKMADIMFRAAPYKTTMEYARARSREGLFDPTTREAWAQALIEWEQQYGRLRFATPKGWIMLNATEDELRQLAEEDGVTLDDKKEWQGRERDITNYRYWRILCSVEQLPEMVEARRLMYEGRRAWIDLGDAVKANTSLLAGMAQFEQILNSYEDGLLLKQDDGNEYIEDAIDAVLLFKNINSGRALPETYPLKSIFDSDHHRIVGIRQDREERFQREMFRQ
jgi:hypothetical protein